jgi:hypothetical protein
MQNQDRVALTQPIRSERLFVKKTQAAVSKALQEWAQAYEGAGDFDYELRNLLEALTGEAQLWFELNPQGEVYRKIQYRLSHLEYMGTGPYDTWLQDYAGDVQSIQDTLSKHVPSFRKVTLRALEGAAEEEGYLWDAEWKEGVPPQVLAGPARLKDALSGLHKALAVHLARYEATRTKDVKPGAVETLYHASANARKLYSTGFSSSVPDEALGMGLGGSQEDKSGGRAISMTYDQKAAFGIARVYKELALVYKGGVKPAQILDWVRREGNPKGFLSFLDTEWRDYALIFSFEGGKWHLFEPDPVERTRRYRDPDKVFSTPRDRVKLYKAYLSTTTSRFNPFFLHIRRTAEYLAKRPGDIGVLAVEVDMTHPSISYHPGEKEYRIPPEAVIRIKKFLR